MDSIASYFTFSQRYPELFRNSELIPLCMDEAQMRRYAAETGKEMGMVFDNHPYFYVLADLCSRNGNYYRYARIVSPNADSDGVVIIPVKQGKLGLISIFRHAPRMMSLEFVRGFSDGLPVDSAVQEIREEIGANIAPDKLRFLGEIRSNTGLSAGKIQVFTVEIEDAQVPAQNGEGIERLRWLTVQEFHEAIAKNEITCGITLAAYTKYLYRDTGERGLGKRDRLAEFTEKLKGKEIEERKKYTGYISQLRFKNKSGTWMRERIRERNRQKGIEEESFWKGVDNLTQLPDQVELVALLLDALYPRDRSTNVKKESQGLRKLGPALKLYRELMLNGERPPEPVEMIPQEGPLCFAAILNFWVSLDENGKETVSADAHLANRLIQILFAISDARNADIQFEPSLSAQDGAKLRTVLIQACVQIPNLYSQSTASGGELSIVNKMNLLSFKQKSFLPKLRALNAYLAEHAAAASSVDLRREMHRLATLEQYPDHITVLNQRRILFFQIFLSLLASTLPSDSAVPDAFQRIRKADCVEVKLAYCVRQVAGTMTKDFLDYLKRKNGMNALFSASADEGALEWVDCLVIAKQPHCMAQLCQISEEVPVILNVSLPDDSEVNREQSEIACAAKAILRLLIGMVQVNNTSCDRELGKAQLQIARNLLYCFDVFRKDGTDPEEAAAIRSTVMHLLKSKAAALEKEARKIRLTDVTDILTSIFMENEEYLRFLRTCQALDQRVYSDASAPEPDLLHWSTTERLLLDGEIERVQTALHGISICQNASVVMKKTNEESEFRRPIVSDVFDSVASANAQDIQLTLASIVLRSRRLILLGPQIVDNPQVLELVKNADFLRLIQNGTISFSTYGNMNDLMDYARECFAENSAFRFSGYTIFQNDDAPALRKCMRQYFVAEDATARKRAIEQFPVEYCAKLASYVNNISLFSEALDQQLDENNAPLYRFYHQRTGWRSALSALSLSTEIASHIGSLDDRDLMQQLSSLHGSVQSLALEHCSDWLSVTRSQIFNALEQITDFEAFKEDYRFIVNRSYFKQITERVTPYRESIKTPNAAKLIPHDEMKLGFTRVPVTDLSSSHFTMQKLADFSDTAQEYVKKTGASTVREILSGVLNDDTVQMPADDFVSFASKIEDPVTNETSVIEEKANEDGEVIRWNSGL